MHYHVQHGNEKKDGVNVQFDPPHEILAFYLGENEYDLDECSLQYSTMCCRRFIFNECAEKKTTIHTPKLSSLVPPLLRWNAYLFSLAPYLLMRSVYRQMSYQCFSSPAIAGTSLPLRYHVASAFPIRRSGTSQPDRGDRTLTHCLHAMEGNALVSKY